MSGNHPQGSSINMPLEGGIYSRNTVATAELCEVPDNWKGRYVTIQAFVLDVQVLFGDSGVVATVATRSAKSTNALVKADGVSWTIPAGQSISRRVPGSYKNAAGACLDVTHFSFVSTGTSGHWEAFVDDEGGQ